MIEDFDREDPGFRPQQSHPLAATRDQAMAAVEFALRWHSEAARHHDRYIVRGLSLGRDLLPPALANLREAVPVGHRITATITGGALGLDYDAGRRVRLPPEGFRPDRPGLERLKPRRGRFYPRGFLAGGVDIDGTPGRTFRVVGVDESLMADLNHPLAGRAVTLEARVLRPGGRFILTFSDRWFPPKVVRVWCQIHEFERPGLVLEYFLRHGRFTDLHTWSVAGLPRPDDDKYADRLASSDPVHAVWGDKRGNPISFVG